MAPVTNPTFAPSKTWVEGMSPRDTGDSNSGQVFVKTTPGDMFGQSVGQIFSYWDLSQDRVSSTYSLLEPQLPDIEVWSLSYIPA